MKKIITLLLCLAAAVAQAQEIGIQLYSVRNEVKKDLKGTLEKVRAMGIRELEGGDLYGMDVQTYRKLLDGMGYKMVSIGVDYNSLNGDLSKTISEAKALGATYVVCFWIGHNGNEFGMKEVEEAAARFNRAGKILKEAGLDLCYHPHGYEFRPSAAGTLFDDLVAKTNPEYINFELDVYWVKQGCADPVAYLKKYPSRMKMLHLKDREHGTACNDTGGADEETNVVLGKGDVNIKGVMKAAKKAGVKHYFIEDESTRVIQQVPQSLAFLRSLK
jgi:sugar phosphate isomerase/epimerase